VLAGYRDTNAGVGCCLGRFFIRFARTSTCATLAAFFLASCGITPASGPASVQVPIATDKLPYAFVALNRDVAEKLAQYTPRISNTFTDKRAPRDFQFGVGDIVSVTIFEAAAGGLFIPAEASVRPGNFITLPNQAVDNEGNISVPYAGNIHAKGRTPTQVQQAIVDALKNRAIEPQAVVSLITQRTSLVTVLGDVNKPEVLTAVPAGEHILDSITRAGGPKAPGYDTMVMLERGGHRATASFGALVYQPSNNIFAHPGDTIYVYNEPQTFLAFGATGKQGQFAFGAWRVSLAEAVAKAEGLTDGQADPAFVLLYRGEMRAVAEQLGIDCSKFSGPIIPVIYNLNLRDPGGFFLAANFEIRNKDVIYTANAVSVEVTKFLGFLRTIMATVNDPIVYATNYYTLLNTIKGVGNATIVTTPTPIVTTTP
jgi:polysaccharide biosynthesis/export protein